MRTLVTAVLIAREGGDWLSQTLAALRSQTRMPDRIIAVSNGGGERVARQLADGGAERVVNIENPVAFGTSVKQAVAALPAIQAPTAQPGDTGAIVDEWLWLLAEDSAPEPEALARILRTVQRAPSVAVAGAKLVDWDHPERIIELGQSLTTRGERWLLRRQELDQQQYDHLQDVLGVGTVGMLVRRDVWEQLEGFDAALPIYDDGLDFSVRARLAGYRVVVAPSSRIRFAQRGIAGPRIDRSRKVLRTAHRQARTAHLHRRISYAPWLLSFLMWLGLPLLAIARMAWALIREQPGRMLGEFASCMRVFFHPGAILASRRRIRRIHGPGWSAVKPLRVDRKAERTARMIDREAILASQGREKHELHFISSGGLGVLVASLVITAVLCWWAFSQTSLVGGSLAPLSGFGELWQNTQTRGGVPADPFTWVLAVIGSVTFWNPSHAIVLVFIAAIPLAALGGWVWATQLTASRAGRAIVGLGWALSPVLLGSLAAGRISTLILAIVLPWLLVAANRCRESWSWSGTASLLTAVALACAPILTPIALIFLVVGLASSVRGITRVLSIAIAPLILFAPKLIAIASGSPLNLLLDPGVTPSYTAANPRQLLLGFPEFGLDGWGEIFDRIGLGDASATLLVGVLLLPLALLAVLGLLTARVHVTLLLAALGGVGLLTAVAAPQLRLISQGDAAAALWSGSGLTLYWISMLGLAAIGASMLRRAAAPVASLAIVLAMVAVSPIGFRLVTQQSDLVAGGTQLPAIVQAAGRENPELRTLVLTPGDGAVRAQVIEGPGLRLDAIRTEERARPQTAADVQLGELVGSLTSTGDAEITARELAAVDIGFVLLKTPGASANGAAPDASGALNAAAASGSAMQSAFDQNTALSSAGQTRHGLLWRVNDAPSVNDPKQAALNAAEEAAASANETVARVGEVSITARVMWWIQFVVLLGVLLLALPTGEVVERPQRRYRAKAGVAAAAMREPRGAVIAEADGAGDAAAVDDAAGDIEASDTGRAEAASDTGDTVAAVPAEEVGGTSTDDPSPAEGGEER